MRRYLIVPMAAALLIAGCAPLLRPLPTAVVRPTERPALATLVSTFTPTVQPAAGATEALVSAATATLTLAPTARPTAAATSTVPPTAPPSPTTAPPSPTTAPPSPTTAPPPPTTAPTRAPTRRPATPTSAPAPAPAPGAAWKGEYFNNPDLNGQPVLVRSDADVNFDWGLGSPDPSVPTDHFSVRWTRAVSLPAGRWRFHATTDDGVRLYVDGLPFIDQWHTTASVTYNTSAALSGGVHTLRLDYYDNVEDARIHLWWEPDDGSATDPAHAGAWRGEYFNNRDLSGAPAFGRDDPAVYFDWGEAGPGGGIDGQDFSVRWTRELFLPGGTYLFTVRADDGVRLWLDWAAIIDQWHDSGGGTTYQRELDVPNGTHTLAVEYYQAGGSARVHLSWQPTNVDWIGNLHTCLGAQNSWVNVFRLAPNNQWMQLATDEYGDNTGGELSLWGVPIDASYGWDGQPYKVELWVNDKMTASDGNIFAGQPPLRLMPGQDVRTSWSCGAALPR